MNSDQYRQPSKKSTNTTLALFFLMIAVSTFLKAQEPSSYQWKNRVLLILVDDLEDTVYKTQIAELRKHEIGLKERKLLTYHIQPSQSKIGLTGSEWKQSGKLYHKYKKTKAPFEIILIGLDGGVKLRQSTFLSCDTLFNTIDSMPMRIREKQ